MIRPARAADAPHLTTLVTQLGYPGDPGAVAVRLAAILDSAGRRVLVATPPDGSRIDGFIGVERRPALLHQGERAEITELVVGAAARRTGVGRALVRAAEQWAAELGLSTVVVRSNVVRPESHPFYERAGYRRTSTSHRYVREIGAAAP